MRLIDADALMPNAEYKGQYNILTAYDVVAAPTIDAVPVVRCRECIHRPSVSDHDEIGGFKYEFPDKRCPCNCEDRWYSWMPDDNWFCGNGQRGDGGLYESLKRGLEEAIAYEKGEVELRTERLSVE